MARAIPAAPANGVQSLQNRFSYAVEKSKDSKKLAKAAASETSTGEKLRLYA